MKKYIAILIFISFIGLAMFGVVAFDHKMNGSIDSCISSQVDNTPCPANLVAAVAHHISVYQVLFNTLVPSVNPLVLLVLLALVIVSILSSAKNLTDLKLKFLYQRIRDFELVIHKARQKFISWLSLLEYSPSFR